MRTDLTNKEISLLSALTDALIASPTIGLEIVSKYVKSKQLQHSYSDDFLDCISYLEILAENICNGYSYYGDILNSINYLKRLNTPCTMKVAQCLAWSLQNKLIDLQRLNKMNETERELLKLICSMASDFI